MASTSSSSGPFGLPPLVVWGGGLVILALVSFGAGFLVGAGPIDDLSQRMAAVEDRAQESESRAEELEGRLHAHRSLSLVYWAMLDMDDRNFGTANEHLEQAADALAQANPEALGSTPAELESIRRELEETDVRVAADLAEQRDRLSELARRLATLLEG